MTRIRITKRHHWSITYPCGVTDWALAHVTAIQLAHRHIRNEHQEASKA